jgi:hypothetical protein
LSYDAKCIGIARDDAAHFGRIIDELAEARAA